MNALLTEDTNDQKCLSTDHGLRRLDIVTIWVFQLWEAHAYRQLAWYTKFWGDHKDGDRPNGDGLGPS